MNVYVCTDHDYHYPVGVASVVVANSEHEARGLLKSLLHERGLDANKPFTLCEISLEQPTAMILCDGNY